MKRVRQTRQAWLVPKTIQKHRERDSQWDCLFWVSLRTCLWGVFWILLLWNQPPTVRGTRQLERWLSSWELVFAEDQNSVPSTPVRQLETVTPALGIWHPLQLYTWGAYTHTHYTYKHKIFKDKNGSWTLADSIIHCSLALALGVREELLQVPASLTSTVMDCNPGLWATHTLSPSRWCFPTAAGDKTKSPGTVSHACNASAREAPAQHRLEIAFYCSDKDHEQKQLGKKGLAWLTQPKFTEESHGKTSHRHHGGVLLPGLLSMA